MLKWKITVISLIAEINIPIKIDHLKNILTELPGLAIREPNSKFLKNVTQYDICLSDLKMVLKILSNGKFFFTGAHSFEDFNLILKHIQLSIEKKYTDIQKIYFKGFGTSSIFPVKWINKKVTVINLLTKIDNKNNAKFIEFIRNCKELGLKYNYDYLRIKLKIPKTRGNFCLFFNTGKIYLMAPDYDKLEYSKQLISLLTTSTKTCY